MAQGQAVVQYLDAQMNELLPAEQLIGTVGSAIEYKIPQIDGYVYFMKIERTAEEGQPLLFTEDQVQQIELRYQTKAQYQEMVAWSDQQTKDHDRLRIRGQAGQEIPIVNAMNQPQSDTLMSGLYLQFYQQKKLSQTTLYNVGVDQWVRAEDVQFDLEQNNDDSYGPLTTAIAATAQVSIPEGTQVALWQIDQQNLTAQKLLDQLLDNGSQITIDRQIQVNQDLFYHIVDSQWIKAKRVNLI
ncbi:hypothetical protein MOO45_07135 [Bombilactobacillus folatiphilus]|uniref:MucBP domain-containing protein n=1 Tax=Bombilactobacillus folatiphilus TaxID=2923362 RepID=A0ABY4P8U6_9LACO|nr:MucBP domain-containing protein [Bombilactobacillus folatiphilus]UQS81954.1 hypothetical protein MOO45_07135 [Bombilactobacillus folatiphilus]